MLQNIPAVQIAGFFMIIGLLATVLFLAFVVISILFMIDTFIQEFRLRKFAKKFNQNTSAPAVIILGYPNWLKFKAWKKPNFFVCELKPIIKELDLRDRKFSIYPHASREDVEKIMSDISVKEVYFCGHGDSHTFQLSTDNILYYCDFSDSSKYKKEFVHQVHCGKKQGKSLIQYVVPEENQAACFYYDHIIFFYQIRRWFNKRIKKLIKSPGPQ